MNTEYEKIIKQYADNKENKIIPNSTIEHAYIGTKFLFEKAESSVKIITTTFYTEFWQRLYENIKNYLSKNNSNKLEIIAIENISDNKVLKSLKKLFEKQVDIYNISFPRIKNRITKEEFLNFMVIEPIGFRLEVSDKEIKNSIVCGILNFGDKDNTIKLTQLFDSIKKLSEPVCL